MFTPPIESMLHLMREVGGLNVASTWPSLSHASPETAQLVLEEMHKLCSQVVEPTNRDGDKHGATWHNHQVSAAPGFKAAFEAYRAGGWQGLQHPEHLGGQGLPKVLSAACTEMLNGANLSFALCPLLTDGAIETLMTAGSPAQQNEYIPKLIDGEWTGTMNLTEPQAGSDLAQVKTKAVLQPDGTYRLYGQKIYITYGEHDLTDNIVHLVLARTPDAPDGVKGLSLFIVPKFVDSTIGAVARNDVVCVSLEHKLGIHASPTAVMVYGSGFDESAVGAGAVGYLLGKPFEGLKTMFIMMNAARFAVGMQGVGVAEVCRHKAHAYAAERVQSRPVDGSANHAVPIANHPDVKRMLDTMDALVMGARALSYWAAGQHDAAMHHPDSSVHGLHQTRYELLVPIVKAWCTEMCQEVATLSLQVHGGMGYIEDTGIAQCFRDARILTIYEGTTAIQANDLLSRKVLRDHGQTVSQLLSELSAAQQGASVSKALQHAFDLTQSCTERLCATASQNINSVYYASVAYLKLLGIVMGAGLLHRMVCAQGDGQTDWASVYTKYEHNVLPNAHAHAAHIQVVLGNPFHHVMI